MCPLPKQEAKIVVRPRISKMGPTLLTNSIWQAAGLDSATRDSHTICPNFHQNIMVISPPNRDNAACYVAIKIIYITGEVSAYEADSHSRCKGVIHCAPLSDGPAAKDKFSQPEEPHGTRQPVESRTTAPWWSC
ncbi:hypothetical protein HPB50_028441 [Hyalomma asiaticum]|nr:hypothetical protein HPB50_028441 [Hyalomma asiaticum]